MPNRPLKLADVAIFRSSIALHASTRMEETKESKHGLNSYYQHPGILADCRPRRGISQAPWQRNAAKHYKSRQKQRSP